MTVSTTRTPEGVVVRRQWPSGECFWRRVHNGDWSYCASHKGPWLSADPPRWAVEAYNQTTAHAMVKR